jgi:hypothetical protein
LILSRGTDSDKLSEAVEAVKTKYPAFFTIVENASGQKGTGNPVKPGSGGSVPKEDDLGKRLAEQRNSGAVKATNWA